MVCVFVLFFAFICICLEVVFFFFKQKTAYEVRISDWSSDVCSSDLALTWLAVAVFVLSVSFLPLARPDDVSARLPLALTPLLHLASQALFPAAVLGVVLRQKLWGGVDLAVRRTLTWWLLTSGLIVTYIVVVTALGELIPGDAGFARVLTTAIVAAGFQPARSWVQRRVDELVHGSGGQPSEAVRQVSRTLGSAGATDDLIGGVLTGQIGRAHV